MNNLIMKRKRPNPLLVILTLFFFSSQLIIFPEPAKAEMGCWNDGVIGYAPGGATPQPLPLNQPGQPEEAEPVNLATGNFEYNNQDLFIPGRGLSIDFTRTYNSQDSYDGPLGYGWGHTYNIVLAETSDGEETYVIRRCPNGRLDHFKKNPDGSYKSPPGIYDILTKEAGNFIITEKHGTRYTFDSEGRLLSIKDRNDNQISLNYHPAKKTLTSITDTTNRTITLAYNSDNKLVSVTDFTGRKISYSYYGAGNLKSATTPPTTDYPAGLTTKYEYDGDHNLTQITDSKGQTYLINNYNSDDKVVSQQYGYGTFYFSYDTTNRITTLTDRKGYKKGWKLYENGVACIKTEYTAGLREKEYIFYQTAYTYNENRELTGFYRGSQWIKYTYDDRGNILEIRQKKIMGYSPPDVYDPGYEIVTSFTYEPNFNHIKTITDPRGNVTTYDYDSRGNLIKITYPTAGEITPEVTFTYNVYGQVETVTDPNQNITRYEYFPDTGYLKKIIAGFGSAYQVEAQLTWDTVGNITSITDPRGNTASFSYNRLNQLIQVTSPAPFNCITDYFYDRNGNLERVSSETGNPSNPWQTTIYTYDILDQLKAIIDGLGNKTTLSYDANGNITSIKDAEGTTTSYVYDERDLLWKVTDALGNTTEYAYNENAKLKEIKDANSNKTKYSYDIFSRLTTTTYPDSTTEKYTYDKASNLIQKINRRNNTITYSYDELNHLIQKTTPEDTISYSYDSGSRMISVGDSSGAIHYAYDGLNRVTQVTYPDSNQLRYEYDASGNRTKLIYPDLTHISYEYDQLNRLTAIKDQALTTIASYAYDALSRRIGLNYANGTQAAYGYDAINQLTALTNTFNPAANIYSYSYDKVGNRLAKTDTTGTESYTYDKLYQLTNVTYPDASSTTYSYDKLGNRIFKVNGGTTNYAVNSLNQYSQVSGVPYTYDNNGNLTSDGTNTYTYDSENRLVNAVIASQPQAGEATYTYDPFGRRIRKNIDGTTTHYIYDGDQVICETDSTGIITAKYIYGPGIDEPITMQRGGDTYYYHFDGLGSVTALTNSSGETVESYSYDVYGKPSTTSTIGNPYMFTAREYDSETGLYYYRARMYSPELGRFLQTDPIGYWGGINLYTYCNNDPINWIDPWGLCKDKNKGIFPEGYMYGPDGKPIEPTGPENPTPKPPKPPEQRVVYLEVRGYRSFRDFSLAFPGMLFVSRWELYTVEAYYENVPKSYQLKKTETKTFYEFPLGFYDYKYENIWYDYGPSKDQRRRR